MITYPAMHLVILLVPVLVLTAVHLWVRWQERHVAVRSPVLSSRLKRGGKRYLC